MSEGLIIVESPAKARTISKFTKNKYEVKASMGHVKDLPRSTLGIDVEKDFEPKYINIKGKGPIIKELKKAAKHSKILYLAPDPDREGEAIAWHLASILNHNKTLRIELHEITESAVKNALKNPRPIDQNKVEAQQARRILDRLVGYKISPILWNKIQRGLSAGRVQSVAMRLICEREEEIEKFKEQEYWTISALLTPENKIIPFLANLIKKNDEKIQINSKTEAKKIQNELEKSTFIVKNISTKKQKKNPPPPFITSTLQQEAARRLNFRVAKTMIIAQQLYEGLDIDQEVTAGLITYMRTDSLRTSEVAKKQGRAYILKNYGKKYIGPERKYKVRPGAQEAHEAIRPTDINLHPKKIKKYLNQDQYRLYKLIWERFLASLMESAVLEIKTIDIYAGEYLLRTVDTTMAFDGFDLIYKEDKNENEKEQKIPELNINQKLNLTKINPEQHFTQPLPRYTEASLIKTLEEKGIGRPSTYAPIVLTIQKREYVQIEQKKFIPSKLGRIVTEILIKHFPVVFDVDFTAQMEEKLDAIEDGKTKWIEVIKEFYPPFEEKLEKAKETIEKITLEPEDSGEVCPKCGKSMLVKHGRFGKFLACAGYPDCKTTKSFEKDTGLTCPEEGCGGKVILKNGRKGKFYGCSNYPKCNFASWYLPIDKRCERCGKIMVLRSTRKGNKFIICIDPECSKKSKETKPEKKDNEE